MVGATGIFVLLSIFYYEYVPEGTFADKDEELSEKDSEEVSEKDIKTDVGEVIEKGVENEAMTEEAEF